MIKKSIFNVLLSPWMVFAGIASGCFIGFKYPELGIKAAPFGDLFLSLLQMCIIPILITAVVSSLGKLLKSGNVRNYIGKLLIIFSLGLFFASIIGITIGSIAQPGKNLNETARTTLGKLIARSELTESQKNNDNPANILNFFTSLIPSNVFEAFSHGRNLAILFFCMLFGIALGFVRSSSADTAISVTEAMYDAFLKLIGWIMYFLPFGLFCIFASEISKVGISILKALTLFVIVIHAGAIILMSVYHCLIWWKIKGSFLKPFTALRETLMVALGTSSSFASIPSALRCLQNNLNVDRGSANLVIPLGVNLNPQGSVLHFALSTVFIAQIYNVSLGVEGIVITIIGAILVGMAATGMPGAGSLSMLGLILAPLGLPGQAAIIFLIAIDPIIDPILTVTSIHANCAATVLVSEIKKEQI